MPRKKSVEPVDSVQAEYTAIITRAIIKHGSLVRSDSSLFGWVSDEDYGKGERYTWPVGPRHSITCGIAKTGRVDEHAYWYEFMGTFYEGDNTVHGMEVHGVTCNCGRITDRTFRWKESVGEAIRLVMMELLEERVKGAE